VTCMPSAGPAGDGRIQSRKWNVAQIDEVTTGAIVREALDMITDLDCKQAWGDTDRAQVAAFRSRLGDEAQYEIHALEV
jgi:hypothetical protein